MIDIADITVATGSEQGQAGYGQGRRGDKHFSHATYTLVYQEILSAWGNQLGVNVSNHAHLFQGIEFAPGCMRRDAGDRDDWPDFFCEYRGIVRGKERSRKRN